MTPIDIRSQGVVLRRLVALTMLVMASASPAQEAPNAGDSISPDNRVLSLPYGFWNESFGLTAAYVYAVNGFPQPQASVLATVMAGTEGSAMGFFMGRDIRVFGIERLFLDPIASVGYFSNANAFINGNPEFAGQQAGANGSDPDNFVTGNGVDNFFRLRFKYLLPIGHGRDQVISQYHLDRGLLESGATGGKSWNPITSGRTFLEIRPFYRSQVINGDDLDTSITTNGADFSAMWDNRDYPASASKGNALSLRLSRDFGQFNSSGPWTALSGEYDHYISLGATSRYRQRVIALNIWTADSSTWKQAPDGTISNRPPAYTGASLGGLWRMRAFPTQRFSDKAAIYYAAELRLIPEWNLFNYLPRLQERVGVQWVQFVGFVEVGRVAPRWTVGALHSSMQWDGGVGVRLWAKGLVVRVDTALSNEGVGIQMMVSQPFQF